eukprot:143210_1
MSQRSERKNHQDEVGRLGRSTSEAENAANRLRDEVRRYELALSTTQSQNLSDYELSKSLRELMNCVHVDILRVSTGNIMNDGEKSSVSDFS